jgi:prophage regulatory protein
MPAIRQDRAANSTTATGLDRPPARAAVESVLTDLLTELRRRGDRLLDLDQVSDRTTLARSTIWQLENAGQFPRRRQITANKVGWLESEIEAWIAGLPTVREAREDCR